jgi:uncharacterized protein (TIGR02679 family)
MSEITKQAEHNFNQKIQHAVEFFQHPDRIRLLEALYQKYIVLGRIGGQVTLRDSSYEERREIASFLNKSLPPQSDITVRLSDFQQALSTSKFACGLSELLAAFFPDRPQVTNPQRREQRDQSQARFFDALTAITQQAGPERGQRWLLEGRHGQESLFRRYKNASPHEQGQLLHALEMVVQALDQLPQSPNYERLAPFATRISGEPHFLDFNTFSGRLFYSALHDLALLEQRYPGELEDDVQDIQQTSANTERLLLYYDAGLLLDTVSSTIAVYNLAGAADTTGQPDTLVAHAQRRLLVLPLHQLLKWQKLTAASQDVYLFENPQVFEEVVDTLQKNTRPSLQHPTLLCTSGWPSAAAIRLLDGLLTTEPTLRYHYSGDFDVQGLRIAAYLQKRYPHNLILWHFTPAAYLSALHEHGSTLSPEEIESLRRLPDSFAPLIAVMAEQRQRAYQESVLPLLVEDVSGDL